MKQVKCLFEISQDLPFIQLFDWLIPFGLMGYEQIVLWGVYRQKLNFKFITILCFMAECHEGGKRY